jgi:hypothetical protein
MLIDERLRSASIPDFQDLIKKIILIFKLVKEKTLFENIYRRTLINRLVHYFATYKLDEEITLIEAMEKECGEEWTLKIKEICNIYAKDREALLKSRGISIVTDDCNWRLGGLVPVIIT